MSRRDPVEIDLAAENKLLKSAQKLKITSEDASLALHARQSGLFDHCGGDMTVFTSLLQVLSRPGAVSEELWHEANALALQRATAHPLRPQPEKISDLRVELRREPSAMLASLLEEFGFVSVSKAGFHPLVYYGEGPLRLFKRHVQSPDEVAECRIATRGVEGRRLSSSAISLDQVQEHGPSLHAGPAPQQPILEPASKEGRVRLDKLIDKPAFADELVSLIATSGPLPSAAVIAQLRHKSRQTRMHEATKKKIAELLTSLVFDGRLHRTVEGLYRLKETAPETEPASAAALIANDTDREQSVETPDGEPSARPPAEANGRDRSENVLQDDSLAMLTGGVGDLPLGTGTRNLGVEAERPDTAGGQGL